MTGMVGALGVVAEVDPTVQPVRASFYVFVFMALMLVILLFSFLRHVRRAQANLGSGKQSPAVPGMADSPPPSGSEDDVR